MTTGTNGADPGVTDPQERAREGLEHLQAAARELIHAARAMLDVAEALVDDPETVSHLVGALGTVGDVVRQAAAGARPARRPSEANGAEGEGDGPAGTVRRPGTQSSSLQRITVT
jgi:hypothetical protein